MIVSIFNTTRETALGSSNQTKNLPREISEISQDHNFSPTGET